MYPKKNSSRQLALLSKIQPICITNTADAGLEIAIKRSPFRRLYFKCDIFGDSLNTRWKNDHYVSY